MAGIGVHNGMFSTIILSPAPVNTGIVITNKLYPNDRMVIGKVIPEAAPHATVMKYNDWSVSTIEHLMAAIWALGIDNLIIQVEGKYSEIPILDGSAYPFMQALAEQGVIVEQGAAKRFVMPASEVIIQDAADRFIKIEAVKFDHRDNYSLSLDYTADFEHPLLGSQKMNGVVSSEYFKQEIAPARTFGFLEQLPMLRHHKLALGSSLGNSVVVGADGFFNEQRFDNEFVRHKVLDLLGDLALLGKKLVGKVSASKTGHSFNRKVIEHYIRYPEQWQII